LPGRGTGGPRYAHLEGFDLHAALHARIGRLEYGAADPKVGAARTLYRPLEDARLNHQVAVVAGVRSAECSALLIESFHKKRS